MQVKFNQLSWTGFTFSQTIEDKWKWHGEAQGNYMTKGVYEQLLLRKNSGNENEKKSLNWYGTCIHLLKFASMHGVTKTQRDRARLWIWIIFKEAQRDKVDFKEWSLNPRKYLDC